MRGSDDALAAPRLEIGARSCSPGAGLPQYTGQLAWPPPPGAPAATAPAPAAEPAPLRWVEAAARGLGRSSGLHSCGLLFRL